MEGMGRPRSRTLVGIEITAGALLWLINAYRLATKLQEMGFLDAVCAGMIFFVLPATAWRAYSDPV